MALSGTDFRCIILNGSTESPALLPGQVCTEQEDTRGGLAAWQLTPSAHPTVEVINKITSS